MILSSLATIDHKIMFLGFLHPIFGSGLNALRQQNPQHIDGYASNFVASDRPNLTQISAHKTQKHYLMVYSSPISLTEQIQTAAKLSFLDPKLVEAVIKVESNFKPNATSPKGAMGLMQVMPQTTEECGIHDPYHSLDNLVGACRCLKLLMNYYKGNIRLALAAYNAGVKKVDQYKGIPPFPETRNYVSRILATYKELKALH